LKLKKIAPEKGAYREATLEAVEAIERVDCIFVSDHKLKKYNLNLRTRFEEEAQLVVCGAEEGCSVPTDRTIIEPLVS
jgi:hypothetical protein